MNFLTELSDTHKILVVCVIFGVIFTIYYTSRKSKSKHNKDSVLSLIPSQFALTDERENMSNDSSVSLAKDDETSADGATPETNVNVLRKFRTRNQARNGYSTSNYVDGQRGKMDTDAFFNMSEPQSNNNMEIGVANDQSNFASYTAGTAKKQKDVDKFNAEKLLPQDDNNNDWFDNPYEQTSIKNSKLINIYKPIGVNTIGSSLKNANRQLRADPPCPKFAISPWNNSSYEPDTNIRAQTLCG